MQKLERLGCSKSVVGLVVPSGYSFSLVVPTFTSRWRPCSSHSAEYRSHVAATAHVIGCGDATSKASGVTGAGFITRSNLASFLRFPSRRADSRHRSLHVEARSITASSATASPPWSFRIEHELVTKLLDINPRSV
jgi:hypothetical protein